MPKRQNSDTKWEYKNHKIHEYRFDLSSGYSASLDIQVNNDYRGGTIFEIRVDDNAERCYVYSKVTIITGRWTEVENPNLGDLQNEVVCKTYKAILKYAEEYKVNAEKAGYKVNG